MRDPQVIMAEVNEDFSRLRELNEQMTKATASADPLDYKYISETSADIESSSFKIESTTPSRAFTSTMFECVFS